MVRDRNKKTDEFIAAAPGYINSVHERELTYNYQNSKGRNLRNNMRQSFALLDSVLKLKKQTKLRELENEQLEKDHRKEVAAAALEEIDLMTKSSADGSGKSKMSGLFTERCSVKSKKLVQDWVNSSPAGNMADVSNKPSWHFSGSIAQNNQAIVQLPSSTQLPISHFNLNTHGQVEANINLPVHEPHDPSDRTNVTNDALVANNIMQEQRQPQYTPPSPPKLYGMMW